MNNQPPYKQIPTISRWTVDDLNDKSVKFRIPAKGGIVQGLGKFLVASLPGGKLAIDVTTDVPGATPDERVFSRYALPQNAVDHIEHHPDATIAEFSLEV